MGGSYPMARSRVDDLTTSDRQVGQDRLTATVAALFKREWQDRGDSSAYSDTTEAHQHYNNAIGNIPSLPGNIATIFLTFQHLRRLYVL
jgi:hypothetical protein